MFFSFERLGKTHLYLNLYTFIADGFQLDYNVGRDFLLICQETATPKAW